MAEVPKQDPSHIIVLNKFPIIEHHFILATKRNKQQTARLEEDDLARTYQCLEAWKIGTDGAREDGKLFAFFNSGEHSGASQPHRHLQLLPVEDMKAGCNGQAAWGLLTDEVLASQEVQTRMHTTNSWLLQARTNTSRLATNSFRVNPSLPFVHFGKSFPPNVSPSIMYQIYSELYDASLEAVKRFLESHPQELQLHSTENDALPISYNLAMTTEGMVICPRRSDGKKIERPDGSVIDTASLNGTVLGGTMMVKNEELFNLLKNDSSKVASLLNSIGLPSSTSNLGSSHL